MSIMDNTAVARIAAPDLARDVNTLLERLGGNDDVVFFLGRLVWQGGMRDCVPALLAIAIDPARGRYARVASIRAVMTLGDDADKETLWSTIAADPGPLDRVILSELADGAAPSMRSVELLLATVPKLAPKDQFEITGLGRALHSFIDRLPVMADKAEAQPLAALVEGMDALLDTEPYIERRECHVSKAYAWLLAPALHAVDRLVATRARQALGGPSVAVLRKSTASIQRGDDTTEYRTSLGENVPRWQELNDVLYWTSVAERRAWLADKGERVTDDWRVSVMGHYWNFGPEDFERCLTWVRERSEPDDRLVALSRCVALYLAAGRPAAWLTELQAATKGEPELAEALVARINPKPSRDVEEWEAEHREWKRKRDEEDREDDERRAQWIAELKADPDRVRHPANVKPGEWSSDQYHLLLSESGGDDEERGANWRSLIPEFGDEVALAYRDAAVAFWRTYSPPMRSEGADTSGIPYVLLFAMAGLAIEARETPAFATSLTPEDAQRAFRFITWQLNGFPAWLEAVYAAHPDLGWKAIKQELVWELDNSGADAPLNHILHDIVYHAPWLHGDVARFLLDWFGSHDILNADNLRYGMNILASGALDIEALAALVQAKLAGELPAGQRPRWYALWTDCDPEHAIPAVDAELTAMDPAEASKFAQAFIATLLGGREGGATRIGAYRTPACLKALYVLSHRYVRTAEDIQRANRGVYSPTERDHAQEARDRLFDMLTKLPGPESYAAIKALELEHPEPGYRRWMASRARARAIADADEPLWNAADVAAFASELKG
jgi:hypothetical protein